MDSEILENKRLIVVLPGRLVSHTGLANQMRTLAQRIQAGVLYLALAENAAGMMELAHKMKTMEALTHGTWVVVVANMIDIPTWRKSLQKIYRAQDLIVLASEQNVKSGQFRPVQVTDFLCAPLKKQNRTAQPTYRNNRIKHTSYAAIFLTWIGFALLVVFSSYLEKEDLLRLNDFIMKHSAQ